VSNRSSIKELFQPLNEVYLLAFHNLNSQDFAGPEVTKSFLALRAINNLKNKLE